MKDDEMILGQMSSKGIEALLRPSMEGDPNKKVQRAQVEALLRSSTLDPALKKLIQKMLDVGLYD